MDARPLSSTCRRHLNSLQQRKPAKCTWGTAYACQEQKMRSLDLHAVCTDKDPVRGTWSLPVWYRLGVRGQASHISAISSISSRGCPASLTDRWKGRCPMMGDVMCTARVTMTTTGETFPPFVLDHWTWGRAHVGDYSMIFVEQISTQKYGSQRIPSSC